MLSSTSKHTSTETEMFEIPDSSPFNGINPFMPQGSQKQDRSDTSARLTSNGSIEDLDDHAKCNVTEEHLAGFDGAMLSRSLPRSNETTAAIPQNNSGFTTSVTAMLQSNPAYNFTSPINNPQSSGSSAPAQVQEVTNELGSGPVPNNPEDPMPSIRDLNTKCVAQNYEATETADITRSAEAQNPNPPISYQPMLDCPFTVTVATAPSPSPSNANEQTDPRKTNTIYVVRPQTLWNVMNCHRSAIVDGTEYFIQQKAYIRITQPDKMDILRIGHILEIKSMDAFHTYIRVYWMYKPQELPLAAAAAAQRQYGQSELIASNHMNVVSASRIVQPVTVAHWPEGSGPVPPPSLFWRWHYDVLSQELVVVA